MTVLENAARMNGADPGGTTGGSWRRCERSLHLEILIESLKHWGRSGEIRADRGTDAVAMGLPATINADGPSTCSRALLLLHQWSSNGFHASHSRNGQLGSGKGVLPLPGSSAIYHVDAVCFPERLHQAGSFRPAGR